MGQVRARRDRHRLAAQMAEIAPVGVEHDGPPLDGRRAAIALLTRGQLDRASRLGRAAGCEEHSGEDQGIAHVQYLLSSPASLPWIWTWSGR